MMLLSHVVLRLHKYYLGRCDFITPYVSLKSLILKVVHKYIRIYLYGADPIFKRKTKHSSLTQPSYGRVTGGSH